MMCGMILLMLVCFGITLAVTLVMDPNSPLAVALVCVVWGFFFIYMFAVFYCLCRRSQQMKKMLGREAQYFELN